MQTKKTDSQIQSTNLWLLRVKGKEGKDKLLGMGLTDTNYHV